MHAYEVMINTLSILYATTMYVLEPGQQ